jgi:hypothetical protein
MIVSHYCDWDAPGTRLVRALCGILIRRREHVNEPMCPGCRSVLARRALDDDPGESPATVLS